MPVKSGLDMFRDILLIDPHANVMLMSGYSMSEVVPEDLLKLCFVIKKPFSSFALIEAVKKCLQYEEEHNAEATFAD